MRFAIILRALALLVLASLPARAQTCTVTPPTTFNLGTVDVLANANVDVTGTVNISCTGTANAAARLCLNLGDPNAEAGGIRKARNAANQISYEIYSNAARTTRWSSWYNSTGAGLEHLFTFTASGTYTGSVTMYARVPAGQMAVVAGNPTLTYTEAFSGVSQLHQRARYISSGILCPAATTGTRTWGAMTVSVSVPKKCLITGSTLDFGTVTALSSILDVSTNLSVSCSNTLSYNIGLDNGLNGTLPTNRKMKQGVNTVSYSLYRDAARTLNWGSTIGTDTFSGTGTGSAISVPVYGRVPVQTTPPPQTYTDTVVVTVTY
jgi:spore coat protein U-like protein